VSENGKQKVICAGCSRRLELSAFPIEFLAGFILTSTGRDSSVATGLTVRGSNSGGGRDFPNPSKTAPEPTKPTVQRVPGLFYAGVERPGRGLDNPNPSSTEVRERVELCLYCPTGASRPVVG